MVFPTCCLVAATKIGRWRLADGGVVPSVLNEKVWCADEVIEGSTRNNLPVVVLAGMLLRRGVNCIILIFCCFALPSASLGEKVS